MNTQPSPGISSMFSLTGGRGYPFQSQGAPARCSNQAGVHIEPGVVADSGGTEADLQMKDCGTLDVRPIRRLLSPDNFERGRQFSSFKPLGLRLFQLVRK